MTAELAYKGHPLIIGRCGGDLNFILRGLLQLYSIYVRRNEALNSKLGLYCSILQASQGSSEAMGRAFDAFNEYTSSLFDPFHKVDETHKEKVSDEELFERLKALED